MQPESPVRMFRALSDATRLGALCLLRQGELCAGDLVALLRVPQPTASRHLQYLRRAGLVAARREGRWMFYSLSSPRSALHEGLLACLARCAREAPGIREALSRGRRLRRDGGCCPPGGGRSRRASCRAGTPRA